MFTVSKSKSEMSIHVQKCLLIHAVALFLSGLGTLMVIWRLWDTEFHKTLKSNFTFCRATWSVKLAILRLPEDLLCVCYIETLQVLHHFCWYMSLTTWSTLLPGGKNVLRAQRNAFKETFWPSKIIGEYHYHVEIFGQGEKGWRKPQVNWNRI